MLGTRRLAILGISAVLLVGACGPTPTASVPPSTTAGQASEGTASEPTAPAASPASDSTPKPSSKPSAKPAPAVWSKPRLVRSGDCSSLAATIDTASRYHVAAVCKNSISYLVSSDGRSWTESRFDPPAHRFQVGPQLAVDGDTVYLAYTRLAPTDGGCGDDGLRDVGVYVRTRHLPDGAWSKATRIGREGDSMQSFRVVDGVLYGIVTANDGGPMFYESESNGTLSRIKIPGAIAATVRVGDDGHARIAYSTGNAIRYARVSDGRLAIKTIASESRTNLLGPSFVLGAGDRAYVMWTQSQEAGGGCAGVGPGPLDGTYMGTDAGGQWVKARVSKALGETSFTIDPSTGRIHALVDTGAGLTYYTGSSVKHLARRKLVGTKNLSGAVIRLDPGSGSVVVFGTKPKGIYVMSKP